MTDRELVRQRKEERELVRQLWESLTVSVPVAGKAAARLSRNASYEEVKATGQIAGVQVLKSGRKGKRLSVPTAPLRRVLGLE